MTSVNPEPGDMFAPDAKTLLVRFAELTSDLMTVVDLEGKFLYVNPAAEQIFGISSAELVGMSAFEFIHPEDLESTQRSFEEWVGSSYEGPFQIENRQVGRGGVERRFRWTITPYWVEGEMRCFTSIARDITDEFQANEARRGSETRLRSLFKGVLDPLITIDPRGSILEASSSVERLLGYAPAELVGKNIRILMPEPHHSQHDSYLEEYAKTGHTWILNTTRTFEVVHKSGDLRWVDLSVSRIDVPGEEEPIFCGSFRDVTDRVEAEAARLESERRLRAVFDQEYEFVGLLSCDGTVLDVNRAALEASGDVYEEVIGRPFWETRWWSREQSEVDRIQEAIERAGAGEFVRFEANFVGKRGAARIVDFSLKPVHDEKGRVVMLIPEGRDITELKLAQRRETAMLKALATIGESAAVLAHEIKNPITAVNLALRAVADQLGEGQAEILEDLASRMKRLEKLMRRTLAFTKPLEIQAAACEVKELLCRTVEDLRPELDERGTVVQVSVPEDCPALFVDSSLIEEVLINLLRNAMDALESGGRVVLSAERKSPELVELAVEDDGPGLTDATQDSLFRPFFTTKSDGTGLGLAICKKIIEEHGGLIEAGAGELGGARFCLTMPVAPS